MQDPRNADAADTTSREEWLDRIEDIGEDLGYFEPLGPDHSAFFVDAGTTLLVTFESMEAIRAEGPGRMPMGHALAKRHGWSHLCLISEGESWYRHRAVYGFFDRLTDDAFFEDFDRVVFYGAGMGAYGATAFSVTAPGATVVAVQPVATLDPLVTGWDPRFARHRRLDFNDRYGYAPDMVEGAGQVFLLYDPQQSLDAMQAALFTKSFVTHLRLPNFGGRIEASLAALGLLEEVIEMAATGKLAEGGFWPLYRARRGHMPYLRSMLSRIDASKRPRLTALLCRNVVARIGAPRFRRRLAALMEELEAQGITLPDPVAPAAPRPEVSAEG